MRPACPGLHDILNGQKAPGQPPHLRYPSPYCHAIELTANSFLRNMQLEAQPVISLEGAHFPKIHKQLQSKALHVLLPQAEPKYRGALAGGLEIPDSLRDFWYPIEFSSKLRDNKPRNFSLFRENWQVIRDTEGVATCRLNLSEQG